ncbi:hypothetical protein TYRP_011310 [Tyrophagus putrescentiae]|nr:hypothetical protein TYRP_011310 [Tyrophagus putrescentiae]
MAELVRVSVLKWKAREKQQQQQLMMRQLGRPTGVTDKGKEAKMITRKKKKKKKKKKSTPKDGSALVPT